MGGDDRGATVSISQEASYRVLLVRDAFLFFLETEMFSR